jgi:hypothetical protein
MAHVILNHGNIIKNVIRGDSMNMDSFTVIIDTDATGFRVLQKKLCELWLDKYTKTMS